MLGKGKRLLRKALDLPPDERAALAERILASLEASSCRQGTWPRRWSIRLCRWLLPLSWVVCLAATLLSRADIGFMVAGGVILAPLGLALFAVAFPARSFLAGILGASHVGVFLLFRGLVAAFHWGPRQAELPFFVMGLVYTAATAYPTLLARRRLMFYAPWQCQQCGYALYGLSEPRCPECGEPFHPARLAALTPPKSVDAHDEGAIPVPPASQPIGGINRTQDR